MVKKKCPFCEKSVNGKYCMDCYNKYVRPTHTFKKGHKTNVGKSVIKRQIPMDKQIKAIELYEKGLSALRISKYLNVSISSILGTLRRNKKEYDIKKGFTGRNHSKESKEKVSKKLKYDYATGKKKKISGKDCHFWKGGRSSENRIRINKLEWKRIRKDVLERDGNKCRRCGNKGVLDVHHLIPFRIVKEDKILNLVSVCKKCHMKLEREFERFIRRSKVEEMIKQNILLYKNENKNG